MPARATCSLWRGQYLCSISHILMLPSRTSPLDQFDARILDDNLGCHTYHPLLSGFSSCYSALWYCHHILPRKASGTRAENHMAHRDLGAQTIPCAKQLQRMMLLSRITSVCPGIQWHGCTRPRSVRTRPQWKPDYRDSKRAASCPHLNDLKMRQTCIRVGWIKLQRQ